MKTAILCLLGLANVSASTDGKCRVLALSSGNENAAY